jgi:subtilisin family serine protease
VPNRFIVVLDDEALGLNKALAAESRARTIEMTAASLRKEHALLHSNTLNRLGMMVVETDVKTARLLAEDPRVLLVEQDATASVSAYQECYQRPASQFQFANSYMPTSPESISCWDPQISCSDNWGLDRIDQRSGDVWAHTTDFRYVYSATGNGVHIYIADTGIAWNHVEFLNGSGGSRIGNGVSMVPTESDTYDLAGHGTHVAGIAGGRRFGVAKQATLHPVKVCDRGGSCDQSWVMSGLDWIAANGQRPAVVNMSFNLPHIWYDTSALEIAAARFINWYGIAIVNSAGNWNQDASNFAPTNVPEVIVAGGIDWVRNERFGAPYNSSCTTQECGSNYGPSVDLFAPATDVLSASMEPDRVCRLTGTSMAAPHVTGVAALYLQTHPNATPAEVQSALVANATVGGVSATNLPPFTTNRLLYTNY